ncbi:periplasmic heat shock serine protease HtrA, Do family [Campylobacter blaseri]|uniref:Serine protease n=1 Tax=Campylobacter blaseri TaxID=2042961 RepID=A0A2P8QZM2_9BACT|nr:Do family serine endopeptidase [Campylobacter blaseri]PSM51690.1 serine protease [Campylobacter blaseri]PSM53480.1 serine protease [Campylobacter blaseri]QKF86285.1 periplasmic heat shock serine protease HtrA, Do family [Campylobacter blaseri]
MKKSIIISAIVATSLFSANINFQNADDNYKRINPEFSDRTILSYHSSVSEAKKSVVNISTTKNIKTPQGNINEFFDDPFFKQFFGFNFGIPQEKTRQLSSLGSGVIISKDGYIVTNNHVVEDADKITVTLADSNKEYEAKIIGSDPKTDIAIIKIEKKGLDEIKFADSSILLEGDIVFAIGNPFGVGSTITQGIVSALNKSNIGLNQYENFIQTDASINPGNSGGALVDSRGALVGINSAILSRGGGNNGIGFAIPSNMVKDIAQKLITDGKIERGYIGVMISDLTNDQKVVYKNEQGALVVSVESGLPADKAGLKRGDLIIKANDKDIKSSNELKNLIGSLKPGTKLKITYERGGKTAKTELELANMDKSFSATSSSYNNALKGLSVKEITSDIRQKYNMNPELKGVIVTDVEVNSKAYEAGFMINDIIIQVGDKEISNIAELNKAIKENKDEKMLVWVMRRGVPQGLVIK